MRRFRSLALYTLLLSAPIAFSQTEPATLYYSRLNTFGVFGEYSNDSSHILLGTAQNRKLLDFGASYSRRLLLNRIVNWQYLIQIRPIMLESDPIWLTTFTNTLPPPPTTISQKSTLPNACFPYSNTYSGTDQGAPYSYTITNTCDGRQWTFGQGFSPIGFQWNFLPRHRLQPVFTGLGGYMFSTKPIPISTAGSWNFTFQFGVGFEYYRSHTRSFRLEYRFHHISNKYTASENPGIDSQLFQLTYAFGR